MFTGVLPQFVAILLFVGFALAVLSSETIRRLIGEETGFSREADSSGAVLA